MDLPKNIDIDNRTIYIFDDIDDESSLSVVSALRKMDEKPGQITIVLSSGGGYEYSGYAIYDAITNCRNNVIIDCYGTCSSIATAILQAADYRRGSANCDFLIHSGNAGNNENIKQFEVLELAANLEKSGDRYFKIMSNRTKFTYNNMKDICKSESYFTAQEALKHGLIDEIIQPFKVYKNKRKKKGE